MTLSPKRTSACRTRHGFTLIELVVSALLASIMMAVLLNVTWSAVRETEELRRNDLDRAAVAQMVDVMVLDVQNARGWIMSRDKITLHGFLGGSGDAGTRVSGLVPSSVTYQIVDVAGRNSLMRLSVTTDGPKSELMWRGFGGFDVTILQEDLEPDGDSDAVVSPPTETANLPPVPPVIRFVWLSDTDRVLHSEVIHHHAI